jgi:hypothetical protein
MSHELNPHEINRDDEISFGEKLLGMQGFNAERAKRYRREMEQLLVHRISLHERWGLGIGGALIGGWLVTGAATMTALKSQAEGFDTARWMAALACALTGLVLGGWLLRVAVRGAYPRRLGDVMGLIVAATFCGGWGIAFIGWGAAHANLRIELFATGGVLFAVFALCLLMTLLQWMHRQTQEKLLRIEYHLAELMERRTA